MSFKDNFIRKEIKDMLPITLTDKDGKEYSNPELKKTGVSNDAFAICILLERLIEKK